MVFAKPQKFIATVVSKEKISAKVYLVRFTVPTIFTFIAGQTVMMYVAPGVNRVMSISSSPYQSGYLEMIHDVSPGGPGSQWTVGANIGDTIQMMGPLGRFVLTETDLPKVFVATGTGVAPYYSILNQLLHDGKKISIYLYWGLRFEEDIFWREKFEEAAKKFPGFTFSLSLSQSTSLWTGNRGHVTEQVIKNIEIFRNSEFYLCGNKKMVSEMTEQLLRKNIEKGRIHSELFF